MKKIDDIVIQETSRDHISIIPPGEELKDELNILLVAISYKMDLLKNYDPSNSYNELIKINLQDGIIHHTAKFLKMYGSNVQDIKTIKKFSKDLSAELDSLEKHEFPIRIFPYADSE